MWSSLLTSIPSQSSHWLSSSVPSTPPSPAFISVTMITSASIGPTVTWPWLLSHWVLAILALLSPVTCPAMLTALVWVAADCDDRVWQLAHSSDNARWVWQWRHSECHCSPSLLLPEYLPTNKGTKRCKCFRLTWTVQVWKLKQIHFQSGSPCIC